MDLFYSAKGAAELLNCHVKTVNKLCREKKMKGYKKLGKWYILHSDIITFLTD
jgi:excisionase family DNA binding protein